MEHTISAIDVYESWSTPLILLEFSIDNQLTE